MNERSPSPATGRLSIVGVGVGDMDNITIKARRTIESAHIVLGMGFVLKRYADLLEGKELHDAGHARFFGVSPIVGPSPATREEEEDTIAVVRGAVAAGRNVVVLDFGDPTLYSPQAGYLIEFADLQPVIIPGISSVNAANAVLRKELSGRFDRPVVVTHAMDGRVDEDQLETLAATGSTLIFFTMGMNLDRVTQVLTRRLPGDTPAAIVARAGHDGEEAAYRATLGTIVERIKGVPISWAYLLYVGEALR